MLSIRNDKLNYCIGYINVSGVPYFKGKDITTILGYKNTRDAIIKHVDTDDKEQLKNLGSRESRLLTGNEKKTIMINESGLYSLILSSKLPTAKAFKRWVTSEVLPSIRKSGYYSTGHKYYNNLTFHIESERDLQSKVVQFIKKRYPTSIFTASLGELQDTPSKRISSFEMGYLKGSPDLIVHNLHKIYSGLVIEFKTPKGKGKVSAEQLKMLEMYEHNGFKTLLSNDYDLIVETILNYFQDVRLRCNHCSGKFRTWNSLNNHIKHFHKMST
jgi:prophage antirepressor-like protein